MFVRGTRYLVAAVCVLALTQTTYGAVIFSGGIDLDDDGADAVSVAQGEQITLDVSATVTYVVDDPGDNIDQISLNFSGSDQILTAATWAWDTATDTINTLTDESGMADEVVLRQATPTDPTLIEASSFKIGILTFNAPSTNGTYTVYLTGGSGQTVTFMADGTGFLGVAGGNLTLDTFAYTVTPEPATMAVLGCGGLLALLRRKRRG